MHLYGMVMKLLHIKMGKLFHPAIRKFSIKYLDLSTFYPPNKNIIRQLQSFKLYLTNHNNTCEIYHILEYIKKNLPLRCQSFEMLGYSVQHTHSLTLDKVSTLHLAQ